MIWLLRLLVRLIRRRRYRDMPARILELEMRLGIVEATARRRNELRRMRGELRPHRPPRGGYLAGNVTVAEMGPVPDVLTRPGIGYIGLVREGQKRPRNTPARPPLTTTRQATPPTP